jgi:hypothetical protein
MTTDRTICVLDLRSNVTIRYSRAEVPEDVMRTLLPIAENRQGSVCGYDLRITDIRPPRTPFPGAMVYPKTEPTYEGAIGTNLCLRHGAEQLAVGWLAWSVQSAKVIWDDAMEDLKRRKPSLSNTGFAPLADSARPDSVPWLTVLRLPLSRTFFPGDCGQQALREFICYIAWAAMDTIATG